MDAIFNFFLKRFFSKEESVADKNKSKVLLLFVLSGIILLSLLLILRIIYSQYEIIIGIIPPFILFALALIVLYNGYINTSSGILSLGLTIIFITEGIFNFSHQPTFNFFTSEFYIFFLLLIFSAIFSTRLVYIISFILMLLSSFIMKYKYERLFPNELADFLSTVSFPLFISIFIIIFILTYFFTKYINTNVITEKIMALENKDKQNYSIAEKIKISSFKIHKASSQLNEISQRISDSSGKQAAATEEIAASIEEMLSMINQNTIDAIEASKASSESSKEIAESKLKINQTLKSASNVSKKSLIISEIAGKTDILSINAAIEAARAGDTGKGFSVIAQEIRKLSDIAANAAAEIETLSKQNIEVSKNTSEQLEKVIPKTVQNLELIKNISLANKEQQSNAESINSSIMQLSETGNQNAASAEEMNASATELSHEAEELEKLTNLLVNDDANIK